MELHKESTLLEHKTWSSDQNYVLGLYRFFYRLLGIWPLDCDNFKIKFRVFIILSIMVRILFFFFIILQTKFIFHDDLFISY